MEKLLNFLLSSISKDTIDFEVEENQGNTIFTIRPRKEVVGLIIGKNGKMIKSITQILKIKAVMERKKIKTIVEPIE